MLEVVVARTAMTQRKIVLTTRCILFLLYCDVMVIVIIIYNFFLDLCYNDRVCVKSDFDLMCVHSDEGRVSP